MEELKTEEAFWRPWLSMVTAPRMAWKSILSRNPYSDWRFWFNIVFSSAVGAFSSIYHPKIGMYHNPLVAAIVIVLQFFVEIFLIFLIGVVFGAFAKWLGQWMGGKAGYQKMQAVQIWATFPHLYMVLLWMLAILLGGQPILKLYHVYGYGKSLTMCVGMVWVTILVGMGYAEAHELPIKKGMLIAILTYLLPSIILISLVKTG